MKEGLDFNLVLKDPRFCNRVVPPLLIINIVNAHIWPLYLPQKTIN